MNLNNIKPAKGAKTKRTRVGRGQGSGIGKTCGLGHKGQKARKGGYHKVGFEGGQTPLQRRLPKSGFTSRQSLCRQEVRLSDLEKMSVTEIDFAALQNDGVIARDIKYVKIIASGKINKAVVVNQLPITKGAQKAIEAAGGSVKQ